jgi:hypothetical protein
MVVMLSEIMVIVRRQSFAPFVADSIQFFISGSRNDLEELFKTFFLYFCNSGYSDETGL